MCATPAKVQDSQFLGVFLCSFTWFHLVLQACPF
jgi:hypothetical protein